MTRNSNIFYHLVAFLTVAIWGTTFVATKVLMLNGLSPAQIFTLRFSIAYVLMLCFNRDERFIFNEIFEPLTMVLSSRENVKRLVTAGDYQEFIGMLAGFMEF